MYPFEVLTPVFGGSSHGDESRLVADDAALETH